MLRHFTRFPPFAEGTQKRAFIRRGLSPTSSPSRSRNSGDFTLDHDVNAGLADRRIKKGLGVSVAFQIRPRLPNSAMSSLMIPKMFAAELFGGVVAPARTLENVISQLIAWLSAAMQSQIEKKFAALSFFAGGSAASILAPFSVNRTTTTGQLFAAPASRANDQTHSVHLTGPGVGCDNTQHAMRRLFGLLSVVAKLPTPDAAAFHGKVQSSGDPPNIAIIPSHWTRVGPPLELVA
jgi:hypothetical protein